MGGVAATRDGGTAGPGGLTLGAWVRIALLTAAFGWLYFAWFKVQGRSSWEKKEDWGHSFLMPLLGIYLVWRRRKVVMATPATVFWPGLLPITLGIACYIFFVIAFNNHMMQGYSMILTLGGVCLLLLGPRLLRHVFLPVAMLAFGVMVSERIMQEVTFPLQFLASKGAWYLLRLVSLPGDWFLVDVNGVTLEVTRRGKTYPLNVAEACSGMRMVIAFLALAATVGLLSCRHWWQRVALLLLAVPVALLMNMVRVSVLGLLTMVNKDLATGDAHMLIGTILLFPSLLLFLWMVALLNRTVIDDDRRKQKEAA